MPGTYLVQLSLTGESGDFVATIKDIDATSDVVNSAPVARILNTPAQSKTYQEVALNGAASTDPDGDTLTYLWDIEAPDNAIFTLSNSESKIATFIANTSGEYVIKLTVSDGVLTHEHTLSHKVNTSNTAPKVELDIDSGKLELNTMVTFIARGTDTENDTLTYKWTLINKPTSSDATISPNASKADLTFDRGGVYTVSVTASDGEFSSQPAVRSVRIETPINYQPIITKVLVSESPRINTPIRLEVIALDPNNDPLTYSWTVLPETGATATLSSDSAKVTELVVDKAGWYTVEVHAHDGRVQTTYPHATIVIVKEN